MQTHFAEIQYFLLVLLSNGQLEDCYYLPANDIWVPLT